MGCCQSRAGARAATYAVKGERRDYAEDTASAQADLPTARVVSKQPPAPKQKLDPADFTFQNIKQQVLVKASGHINGQQFIVDNCHNCDILLLDHCAMVTIDDCTNCRIFVGPTESSIFIRNSKDCKCVFLCRQLRTRDCSNCKVLLLCRTRPIIEASHEMKFGCFSESYPGLAGHLAATKLSPFHNFWSHIYDFTPGAAPNWGFLPAGTTMESLLGALPASTPTDDPPATLLHTWGERPVEGTASLVLVLLPAAKTDTAVQLQQQIISKTAGVLLRTNQSNPGKGVARELAAAAKWPKSAAKQLAQGEWISVEVAVPQANLGQLSSVQWAGALHMDGASEEAAALVRFAGVDG